MNYSPVDILDYVLENDKDADFFVAISLHKYGYSIGEIPDLKLEWTNEKLYLKSEAYKLNQPVADMDIMIASKSGKYISAFISRYNDTYQIHFLVHECLASDKANHEDEITNRVVQYMILKTIKQLRLDTPEKVDAYLK